MLKKLIVGTVASLTFLSSMAFAQFDRTKWYKIKPLRNDNKVYDVECSFNENGTSVNLYDDHDADCQLFKFKKTIWGTYTIHPKHAEDKVLDVAEGSREHGAPVIIYDNHVSRSSNEYSRSKNQEFTLSCMGGDVYRIVNLKSGLALGFDVNDKVNQYFDMSVSTWVQLVEVD